jgi:FlaA1/EpsC-like NDP-sugar epimerase
MKITIESWLLLRNRWLVFIHDLLWVPAAMLLAYWVRFNLGVVPPVFLHYAELVILVAIPVHAATFWLFGCYRGIWRYASLQDLQRIVKAVCLGALLTVLAIFMLERLREVPRSILLIYPIFLIFGLSGSRLLYRALKDQWLELGDAPHERALIVGAGRAGELLIRDLKRHRQLLPVALVDDDPVKQGHELHGIRVRGYLADIRRLIQLYEIKVVLIAMPTATRDTMNRVIQVCHEAKVQCRTLPTLSQLAGGRVTVSKLRAVTVEDLLSRDPVELDMHGISDFLKGKCILVTGGGGSIGSELCRQLINHPLERLIVFDNSEFNIYQLEQELRMLSNFDRVRLVLGDIQDPAAVAEIFKRQRPHMVFHAAAYKHVPMVEVNAIEGVRNNVMGTKIVADAAALAGSECFVLISTDKTVNPVSVMGASKRVAELYCHGLNEHARTHILITRFGNVLGSNGSVVPLFERQITAGGPITITHPEMTRYFMTVSEAAGLILQAGSIGRGGEIFVLDMGQPVRISDLAEQMIRLSGLQPGRDIKIVYAGMRPGEKLHEELFYAREMRRSTKYPKLLLADNCSADWASFSSNLARLERALEARDLDATMKLLMLMVPEFTPVEAGRPASLKSNAKADLHIVKPTR